MNHSFLKKCATLGFIGYLPAPGTWASLLAVPCAFFLNTFMPAWYLFVIGIGYCISHTIISCVLPSFNEPDPSCIVIDEVLGCLAAFYALPFTAFAWIGAFVLFRFFDIYKFGFVAWAEKAPGATGILLDDLVAGILSNLCLHVVLLLMQGGSYAVV